MNHSCHICTHPTHPQADPQTNIMYHVCPHCDYIAIDEKHIIPKEEEKHRYAQHQNTMDNEGYVAIFERFIEESINPFNTNAQTVLEFGVGPTPVLAELLKKRSFFVDVYDIYFYPEKVYEGKCYDFITATEVFEHLREPLSILQTLKNHVASEHSAGVYCNYDFVSSTQ